MDRRKENIGRVLAASILSANLSPVTPASALTFSVERPALVDSATVVSSAKEMKQKRAPSTERAQEVEAVPEYESAQSTWAAATNKARMHVGKLLEESKRKYPSLNDVERAEATLNDFKSHFADEIQKKQSELMVEMLTLSGKLRLVDGETIVRSGTRNIRKGDKVQQKKVMDITRQIQELFGMEPYKKEKYPYQDIIDVFVRCLLKENLDQEIIRYSPPSKSGSVLQG